MPNYFDAIRDKQRGVHVPFTYFDICPTPAAAVFLAQLHYFESLNMRRRGGNFRDGHKWVYNTHEEWAEVLHWDKRFVRTTINRLVESGIVISERYRVMTVNEHGEKQPKTVQHLRTNIELFNQLYDDICQTESLSDENRQTASDENRQTASDENRHQLDTENTTEKTTENNPSSPETADFDRVKAVYETHLNKRGLMMTPNELIALTEQTQSYGADLVIEAINVMAQSKGNVGTAYIAKMLPDMQRKAQESKADAPSHKFVIQFEDIAS